MQNRFKKWQKILKKNGLILGVSLSFFVGLISLALVYGAKVLIYHKTNEKLYDDVSKIPKNKVGLVLGCVKHLTNGRLNYYYKYRINAAVELYENDKIDFFIVSGDNGTKGYDEPSAMKESLVSAGIPSDVIYCDYAGFRTLDSVVRANKIFGQKSITIISQPFHNRRAVYIAESKSIKAIGFNAKKVTASGSLKTEIREYFARVKAILDVWVLNKSPKYFGNEVIISAQTPQPIKVD